MVVLPTFCLTHLYGPCSQEGRRLDMGWDTAQNSGQALLGKACRIWGGGERCMAYKPQLLSPSPICTLITFSIQKGSQTQRLVKELQCPCSEQFSWQAGESTTKLTNRQPVAGRSSAANSKPTPCSVWGSLEGQTWAHPGHFMGMLNWTWP